VTISHDEGRTLSEKCELRAVGVRWLTGYHIKSRSVGANGTLY